MLISLSLYMVKHHWSFCYHQHFHLMSIFEVKTQTRFMVLFTSRSLLTWGKPLDALPPGISPRYLSLIYSQLTISIFFYRDHTMTEYAFFSQKVDWWRKEMALMWGDINICPLLQQFQIPSLSPVELSSLNNLKAWRERQKFHHNIAFLLVLAKEEATGDRKYGLLTIWVNPHQARVPSMEEAVGKLTAWASSEPNWPYALLQLHKGTCHAPLPKEEHLGIQPQRGVEETPCGQISQLEICELLIASSQVAYPIGLNGCEGSIITSLPEPLANGISLTRGESIYLEIDILQSLAEELDQKVLPFGEVSTTVISSPHKSTPPKSEGEGSMTMEVRNLLSQVMLDMSGHGSKNSTPRRPNPVVIFMPPPHKPKELLQLVDTSSQVSTKIAEAFLEGILTSNPSIAMTTWSGSIWENANKALEELLTTKASIDACRQRAIWKLGMELCQNESQATKSIKEGRAICSWVTLDAKALCLSAIKEAKASFPV